MQRSAHKSAEKRPRVAIVDDDPDVRFTLEALLHEHGFEAIPLAGSQDYFDLGTPPNIDLVLIDLKLNGESGLSLAIAVKERHDIPIVMLTGVGDEVDKIVGLETGADDYMTKPFNPRELIARIRAVLRRCGVLQTSTAFSQASTFDALRFGGKILNRSKRELLDSTGEEIPLTNAEYRLLEFFLRNPNRIIPRAEMLSELGNDLSQYVDRTIDVLILRLRRKIESVPSKPVHLQTRRGQGYIFVDHPDHLHE